MGCESEVVVKTEPGYTKDAKMEVIDDAHSSDLASVKQEVEASQPLGCPTIKQEVKREGTDSKESKI